METEPDAAGPCTCEAGCPRHAPLWTSRGDRTVAAAHRRLQDALRRLRSCIDPRIEAEADRIAERAVAALDGLAGEARRANPDRRGPRSVRRLTTGGTTSPADPNEG
jgi:hypothetical protein